MYDFVFKYCHGNMNLYGNWVSIYSAEIRKGSSISTAENKAFESVNAIIKYDMNGKY